MNPLNESIVKELRRRQSPARVRHSLSVAGWARELAQLHGADPVRAQRAGWLHDLAKEWKPARLASYVKRHHVPVPGLRGLLAHRRWGLLHGYVSAHVAGRRGFARDRQTRSAMARHTLGHPRMSLLDKIIYVADFSSPDRRYREAEHVRRLARRDLNGAVRAVAASKIREVVQRSSFLHPITVAFWNAVVKEQS